MRYVVTWQEKAEQELSTIWIASHDRGAVSRASSEIDKHLIFEPLQYGESRSSSVHRVAFEEPLGVEFKVIEDDKRVVVMAVFAVG